MGKTRNTRQKELITKEISAFDILFTAEDIHRRVRQKHPKIGLATIYRSLHELSVSGSIHRFRHGRTVVYSSQTNSDAHFTCERCGQVVHIDVSSLDLSKAISAKSGQSICHFQLDVFGVCERCMKKKPDRSSL